MSLFPPVPARGKLTAPPGAAAAFFLCLSLCKGLCPGTEVSLRLKQGGDLLWARMAEAGGRELRARLWEASSLPAKTPPCVTDILACLGASRREPAVNLFDEAGIIRDLRLYHCNGKEGWEGRVCVYSTPFTAK